METLFIELSVTSDEKKITENFMNYRRAAYQSFVLVIVAISHCWRPEVIAERYGCEMAILAKHEV